MVGLVLMGVIGLVNFVSAAACTRTSSYICISCNQDFMTGYNYQDPQLPNAAFIAGYFKDVYNARDVLRGTYKYAQSCFGRVGTPDRDFTLGVNWNKDRYQTQIHSLGTFLQFSQGPEPNPQPTFPGCGYSNIGWLLTNNWHVNCYGRCVPACSPGSGID